MKDYIKPIPATPDLSPEDSQLIVKTLKEPDEEAIERNRKMLEIRKKCESRI